MTPRGLRGRLSLLIAVGAALTLATLAVAFNLLLRSSLDADANRVLEARADAALESVSVDRGGVTVQEASTEIRPDAPVWVYAGRRALERPPAPPEVQMLADSRTGHPQGFVELEAADLRLLSVPIESGGRRAGTAVAALSMEPYERTASKALIASMAFAVAVLILILLATRLVLTTALRPVARMTAEAKNWSEHDLAHRFNAGPPHDELTGLAATFDAMLERLAASLRHEQRLSAEIAHELRTPLAAITAETELALKRERSPLEYGIALRAVAAKAAELESILDTLLLAARAETSPGAEREDARQAARNCVRALAGLAREHGVALQAPVADQPHPASASMATMERMLSPVLENACRYGRSRATVTVSSEAGQVRLLVEDDGPGVETDELGAIFDPGVRGRAAGNGNGSGGAGLGLALARRLARALGGDVRALESEQGARFEIRVPAAGRAPG